MIHHFPHQHAARGGSEQHEGNPHHPHHHTSRPGVAPQRMVSAPSGLTHRSPRAAVVSLPSTTTTTTTAPCTLCASCEASPCCAACSRLTSKWKRVDIPILINKYKRAHEENTDMQNKIERSVSAQLQRRELLVRKQVLMLRVQRARDLISQHSAWTEKEAKRVRKQRQQVQEKMKQLKQAIYNLENSKNSLYNDSHYKSGLLEQRKELALLRSLVADKKKELIFELLTILPVLPVNDQQCRVINVVLPNNGDYTDVPRGVLAAALGYIVHIVKMIASYLEVVLPFRMDSRGSQSLIYREGSPAKYPLFLQTNERDMWSAITALNINVAHLCATQGFLPAKHQIPQTLLNLRRLLQSPNLGSDMPPRKWSGLGGDITHGHGDDKDASLNDWELI